MSSLKKALAMLDVFSAATPVWTSEDLIKYIGTSPATGYRYLKTLFDAGLLAKVANGSYIIGPRVLELDRIARTADPIYSIGTPVIKELTLRTGLSSLLSVLYSDSVMCVQQEATTAGAVPEGLFNRGQRRPLISGASAKIILAYLPPHQLRSVFTKQKKAIALAGLGTNWESFKAATKSIRDAGYCITEGEYRQNITGMAAPIFNNDREVLGSIALAATSAPGASDEMRKLSGLLVESAQKISSNIANSCSAMVLPARSLR